METMEIVISIAFLFSFGGYLTCGCLWWRLAMMEDQCADLQKQIRLVGDVVVVNGRKHDDITEVQLDTLSVLAQHIKSMEKQYIRKFPMFEMEDKMD